MSEAQRTNYYRENRERVIDVAAGLFARQGYARTGVAEIGDAAQLARGALYYYIRSKEAVLAAIHDRVMDPLLRDANFIVDLDLSAPARLRLLSESLLGQIIHRHSHVWVFLHEYRELQGENRRIFRAKRSAFEDRIRQVLAEGSDAGVLTVDDIDLTMLAFLNLHNYTYQWVLGFGDIGVVELSKFYCDILLWGISAPPPDSSKIETELAEGRAAVNEMQQSTSQTDFG